MYKYKRGINELEKAKKIEYTISNNLDTCLSMSGILEAKKPYNGMYIKNGKIILSNLIEKIEIKDKVYNCISLSTSFQSISNDDYINSIDLENNTFEYDIGCATYKKRFVFEPDTDILCIEYDIINKENNQLKFKIMPMITDRDLFTMKTSQMLRFNQRNIDDGTVINLSVTNKSNIILKSKEFNWIKDPNFLNNLKYEYINEECRKEIFIEDLLLPGSFEISVKPNSKLKCSIYISSKEFDIDKIDNEKLFDEFRLKKDILMSGVDEKYIELKNLVFSIENIDMKQNFVSSLPYEKEFNINWIENIDNSTMSNLSKDLDCLTDIVRAIDGQYLIFGRIKEAMNVLINLRRYIKTIDKLNLKDEEINKKIFILKLWYVESLNRFLQNDKNEEVFIDFTREIVYNALKEENMKKYYMHIEVVSLVYNAVKVYEYMSSQLGKEDQITYKASLYIQKLIEEKFWVEEKRVLKKNLKNSDCTATVDMIYAISLSYPCIVGQIPIKLLDTIFKELYTPYGLREISKNSPENKGNIYPKYMAYFVKANLRQNGVTRASQKIAYNLVKELIQDINKYVNGGVKKIYNEKGISIDSIGYDLLTNAEVIRLYDMLT